MLLFSCLLCWKYKIAIEQLETSSDRWVTSVDNFVLKELPRDTLSNLVNSTVINTDKLIIGFNSMDGILGWPYFAGNHPDTYDELNTMVSQYIKNTTQVDLISKHYYPSSDFLNASVAYYTINADVCVICPSLILVETINTNLNKKPKTRTFTKEKGNDSSGGSNNGGGGDNSNDDKTTVDEFVYYFRTPASPYLAPHASELPFVFDKEDYVIYWSEEWSANLSYSMMSAWTNMAKYGIPNITNQWTDVYLTWDKFGDEENVIVFDDNIRIETDFITNYRKNVCHFWWNQVEYGQVENLCFNAD